MNIAPLYVQPGAYFKIEDVSAPLVSPGAFYPLFVGLGRKELDVLKVLTRGTTVNGQDLLTDDEIVISLLSVIDSTGVVYINGTDFKLTETGGSYYVDWNMPQSIVGSEVGPFDVTATNNTIKINIDGEEQTISLTAGIGRTAAQIATDINNIMNPLLSYNVASDDGTGKLKLTGKLLVMIEGGSSLSLLGFTKGQKIESKEPVAGTKFTVGYKRHKKTTEYVQKFFTRLEDVYAEYGPLQLPNEIAAGTVTAVSTGANLVDSSATFITNGVRPGYYVKITNGTGEGQIRVVQTVASETELTFYPNWDENPDTTSEYVVNDIGNYDISWACFYANQGGAQAFVTSQTIDDVVDDNNWRKAIQNTEQLVNGQQGYCLVVLKGLDFGDSLVGYIKNYVAKMNSTVVNQERTALIGVASNITFSNVLQLISGIQDERIGVVVNPYVKNGTNIFGTEYLAAYIAGVFTNPDYDAGEPISGKIVSAFDYIDDPYLMNEKRLIGQNGGILVQQDGAVQKIVHFLSTDTTSVVKSELKVAKQKDSLKKSIRKNLQASIVNTRSQDITIPRTESIVRMILEDKVRITEINTFKKLGVAFEPNDPRQLNVSFEFKPTFDVDWILVTFGATIS